MSWFQAPRVVPRWVRDLEVIDAVLREQPEVNARLVAVVTDALKGQDSGPLSAEQWLRALFVQQTSGYDDDLMGLSLNDSRACRAFCWLVDVYIPEAMISANLRRMDEATWTRIAAEIGPLMGKSWRKQYQKRVVG